MHRAIVLSALLLAGCGPLAVGAGVNELGRKDDPDLVAPTVDILAEDGAVAPTSFAVDAAPRFLLRTNKGGGAVRVYLEHAPFTALPDANGCPRDGSGDLLARSGVDAEPPAALPGGDFGAVFAIDLTAFPPDPFEAEARLWVRVKDAQGRIVCANHTFRIDRQAPAAVTGVSARARRPRSLEVRWTASPEPDVVGYRVRWDVPHENGAVTGTIPAADPAERTPGITYRNPVDEGGAPVDGILVPGGEATATTLARLHGLRPHFVQVVAVDAAGNESALSAASEVTARTRSGGDGRFRAATPVSPAVTHAAAADFNGDRLVDFGAMSCGAVTSITLLLAAREQDGGLRYEETSWQLDDLFDCRPGQARAGTVAADFDRDGVPDLATAIGSSVFVVRFGPPDPLGVPTLAGSSRVDLAGIDGTVGLLGGDVDGDGRGDLVALYEYTVSSNFGGDSTRIGHAFLQGNGDGTFDVAHQVGGVTDAVAVQARSVAQGDFNRDGVPDYAVADIASISIVLLRRDGSSLDVRKVGTQAPPASLVVGEFTGDAVSDLAVSNVGGSLVVLAGMGDGGFSLLGNQPGIAGGSMVAGDFDADALTDLVVARGNRVALLRGLGADGAPTGAFEEAGFVLDASAPPLLISDDLDGDTILDLVVAESLTAGVLLGRGTVGVGITGFRESAAIDATQLLDPIDQREGKPDVQIWPRAGDLDGDGVVDLVVGVRVRGAGVLLTWPGQGDNAQGDGTFGEVVSYVGQRASPIDTLAVADFSGDGLVDVATGEVGPYGARTPEWFPGVGDGALGSPRGMPAAAVLSPGELITRDFDLDGVPDLLAIQGAAEEGSSGTRAVVHFANGSGGLTGYAIPDLLEPQLTAAVGDFNGDGLPDYVGSEATELVVRFGAVGRDQWGPQTRPQGAANAIAAADVNGDGRDDLLLATNAGFHVRLALGPGASGPAFGDAVEVDPEGPPRNNYIHVADWNGDGLLDALVGGRLYLAAADAAGRPTAGFASPLLVPLPFELENELAGRSANGRIAVADFDADGIPDLAVADENEYIGLLHVYLGNGRIVDR